MQLAVAVSAVAATGGTPPRFHSASRRHGRAHKIRSASADTANRILQRRRGDESTLECLAHRALNLIGCRAIRRGIGNGSRDGSDRDSVTQHDLVRTGRARDDMQPHVGWRLEVAVRASNGQVHRLGDDVRQAVQVEGAVVGDNGELTASCQPSDHHRLTRCCRKVSHPIQPTPNAHVATALSVVRQEGSADAGRLRLGRREVARLLLGDLIESAMIRHQ